MSVILLSPRRAQPQTSVTLRPEVLRRSIAFFNAGGMLHDIVKGRVFDIFNAAQRGFGVLGRAAETTATATDRFVATGDWTVSTTDFTLEVLLTMTSRASLSHIWGLGGQVSDGQSRRALLSFGGGSNADIYYWGEGADLDSGVAWRVDGSIQHVFVTATGGTMRFYRDGAEIANGATPAQGAIPATSYVTVGGIHPAGTVAPAMKVFKASVRNYALSADEVFRLTRKPFDDFRPSEFRLWTAVTAAAGGVFIPIIGRGPGMQLAGGRGLAG